jgi:excisionase family DNA binding protein
MSIEYAPDLTRADVARIKKVSPRTVDRWVAAGILPAFRLGPRLIRFRAEDVAAIGRKIKAAS